MVKSARKPSPNSKKMPHTMFFHQKLSKTIDFSCFPCQNCPTVNLSSRHAYRSFSSVSSERAAPPARGKDVLCEAPDAHRATRWHQWHRGGPATLVYVSVASPSVVLMFTTHPGAPRGTQTPPIAPTCINSPCLQYLRFFRG